jgi:hypothetical protein
LRKKRKNNEKEVLDLFKIYIKKIVQEIIIFLLGYFLLEKEREKNFV